MSMKSFHARQHRPRATGDRTDGAPRAGGPRLDALMVERGLAPSRTAAQRLIAAGRVRIDGEEASKPSRELSGTESISVVDDDTDRYVSRGGQKLAGALARTGLDVRGARCLDLGQSTGGFTDCLLQAGAARVVGIDVGHGQLHPRLRGDPRVHCIEGRNARSLEPHDLGADWPAGGFDVLVCDASFISLHLLLPRWRALLAPTGRALALVKPQFEVGPGGLGKGGIVRDPARYAEVEAGLREACRDAGLVVLDWFESAITGGDGNREFFAFAAPANGDRQDQT